VWAVTALVAVFPLNWLGRRLGKNNTLLVAILLMCAAQLSKIVCYHPGPLGTIDLPAGLAAMFHRETFTFEGAYLILIPTMLLSAGMLMFFTLGSSMVGDVCDEDELSTGTRSEGTYYSVFWWFIKMGTAFASLVMGTLLFYTNFDERQNVLMNALGGNVALVNAEAEAWAAGESIEVERLAVLREQAEKLVENIAKFRAHLEGRLVKLPKQTEHTRSLLEHLSSVDRLAGEIRGAGESQDSTKLLETAGELLQHSTFLRRQSPETLYRLRLVEIGLPLVLSIISILLTLRYPLTEARCYEIKEALTKRREEKLA
jgi:Na+/melibiose symporter-like transporter